MCVYVVLLLVWRHWLELWCLGGYRLAKRWLWTGNGLGGHRHGVCLGWWRHRGSCSAGCGHVGEGASRAYWGTRRWRNHVGSKLAGSTIHLVDERCINVSLCCSISLITPLDPYQETFFPL